MSQSAAFGRVCDSCQSFNALEARQCTCCAEALVPPSEPETNELYPDLPDELVQALLGTLDALTAEPPVETEDPPPAEEPPPAQGATAEHEIPGSAARRLGEALLRDRSTEASISAVQAPPAPPASSRRCLACQVPVPEGMRFCGNCGARMTRPQPVAPRGRLVLLDSGGADGLSFTIGAGKPVVIGRSEGEVRLPEDEFLSPRHATVEPRTDGLYLADAGSRNGVFIRIRGPVELKPGDEFLAGEEILRFEQLPEPQTVSDKEKTYFYSSPSPKGTFSLVQVLEGGHEGLRYCARHASVVIGRENADIDFPRDPFISRHHTRVERSRDCYVLLDLGSKNGTFLRLRGPRKLDHSDFLFLGRTLMRVDLPAEAS